MNKRRRFKAKRRRKGIKNLLLFFNSSILKLPKSDNSTKLYWDRKQL